MFPGKFSYKICLIVLLVGKLVGPASAGVPIDAMKACTVRVLCKTAHYSGIGFGSGVIVGNGDRVVTNHHVVACADTGGEIFIIQNKEQRFRASVLWKSDMKDLVVLHIQGTIGGTVPAFATSDMVSDAQTVYAMGFPGAADMSEESLFQVKITKGIISSRTTIDGLKVYQTDAAINSGNSGGPLFNEFGQLIGINFLKASKTGIEGIGYAIQIDELLPYLDRLGISYRKASTDGQPDAPISITPSSPSKPIPIPEFDTTLPKEEQTSSLLFPAIGIAIILSTIAILLSLTKRGKAIAHGAYTRGRDVITKHHPGKPALRGNQPKSGKYPVLRGVSGIFTGNEIRMGYEPIAIGRDPKQCQLVFPSDTTGIGRLHCVVRYDEKRGAFILEDRNSTNGTFLGNGVRIAPGKAYQIAHGGKFYLADSRNMFQVVLI